MRRPFHFLFVIIMFVPWVCAMSVTGKDGPSQIPAAIPSGGRPLLSADLARKFFWYPQTDTGLAETSIIQVHGMPFHQAIQTRTFRQPDRPWEVLIGVPVSGGIAKGDACLLSFSARGTRTDQRTAPAKAHAYIEFTTSPHDKLLRYPIRADSEWRTFYLPFQAKERLPDGSIRVVFHLGFDPQTIEVGGMSMLNFGETRAIEDLPRTPITYEGREADAAWRGAASNRIDQIRKAPLTVEVVDSEDKPLEGAKVRVQMLRHSFGFGSAVGANLLGVNLDDTEVLRDYFQHYGNTHDIEMYRDIVQELFNKAVFENDLKFIPWTQSKSNRDPTYRKEWIDRAFAWLQDRGLSVRGHWIACGALEEEYPSWLLYGPKRFFRSALFSNIRDEVIAVGNRVVEWDAVNHVVDGEQSLAAHFGSPDIYVEIMKLSRKLDPGIELWTNEDLVLSGDGSRREPYEKLIRYLIERGAAPDGVGLMAHFDLFALPPPGEVLQVMERFARIIPNVQITELDVDVGDDEKLQADYFRDMMIAAFSHSACKGIMIWGFWEKRHWKPAGALYRSDWSIKPAGEVWKDLVFRQWWTDAEGRTDSQGRYVVRGFLGQHRVSVTVEGMKGSKIIGLSKAGTVAKIVLP